jgi:hypothetical protein
MTKNNSHVKWFLIISPLLVLIITRIGIEISIRNFRPEISWIPSFIGYYIAITLMFIIASRYFSLPIRQVFQMSYRPMPELKLLFWGIILPALLPLAGFIPHVKFVPLEFLIYILIFACINPLFE